MSNSTHSVLSVDSNITTSKKVPLNPFNHRSSPWDIMICFTTSLPNQNSYLHASFQDCSTSYRWNTEAKLRSIRSL